MRKRGAFDVAAGRASAAVLLGCRPNPFNPSTTIRFDLPDAAHADLSVYTLDGRRVVTLVDGPMPAGENDVPWRAVDASGTALPSGVYLVRLEAEGMTDMCKLVLLMQPRGGEANRRAGGDAGPSPI
jgi:hypothetical protein